MEITEYSQTEAGLAEIAKRMKDVIYDVTATSGMTAAKLDRRELITLRTTLEVTRKKLKAPALERSKAIDGEAKRIETEIRKLEKPIDAQIKTEEKKINDAKQEVIFAKHEKLRLIVERIEKIKGIPDRIGHQTAEKLAEAMKVMEATLIDIDGFGEYLEEAKAAYAVTMDTLEQLHSLRVNEEKAAADVEEQRLADIETDRVAREAAQKILDDETEKLRLERKEFDKEQAEIKKKKDTDDAVIEEKRLADAETKRIEDKAEATRLADVAAEEEKKRKKAEREKKASDRAKKVAEAKCTNAAEAFEKIITIVNDEKVGDETKLDEILVIAEANS